jgi:hypothetical protein
MRRTTRGLVTTLGLGVVLTGCSHSTPPPRIDSADVSAGVSTSGSPTQSTATSGTTSASVAGAVLAARVRAAMTKAGSARFALQSSKTSGPDATGALAIHGTSVSVRFDFTSGTDKLRVIAVPGILYTDVGEVVDGRHWLEVRAGGTDPLSSAMAPLLSYMTNSADVSAQTTSWAAAGGFTASGRTDVAGVTATEYDGTVPRAAVQAGLPVQFRDIMRKDITGDSHLRVWLDGADRPVKVVTSGSYDGKPDLVTVTYGDWGHAPAVTPPPAADVIRSHS